MMRIGKRELCPFLSYLLSRDQREIPHLKHHTLFFENELDNHIDCIYKNKKWPSKPLFYSCCPSKTDPDVAPENCENLFLLLPLAPGIHDEESVREKYLVEMLERIENIPVKQILFPESNIKEVIV
jgi:phytoene dehydrogenase-like protein